MSANAPEAQARTILLIDDEDSVRTIVKKILRRAKYNVIEASSGADALSVVSSHAGVIDLVVTDMYMPGMRGPEVVQQLLAARPGLRVLFMSGYTDQDARSTVPDGANFLHKPFSGQDLAAAVEKALQGSPLSTA